VCLLPPVDRTLPTVRAVVGGVVAVDDTASVTVVTVPVRLSTR
jgi:hypothetical protein